MTAKVLVEEGARRRIVELVGAPRLTIGRSPANAIVIEDTAASREHCALERRGERWFLSDLESKNGTRLNGEAVKSMKLEPGDRIEIGLAKITFLDEAASEPGLEESSGLSSFAKSLGANEPRPSTEERIVVPPRRTAVDSAADAIFAAIGEGRPLMDVLDDVEREVLARALADANGNRSEAARRLQLSRPGMLKKMKRYGIG